MSTTIRPFEERDRPQLATMFDDFQDHLVALDRRGLLRRESDYGARYLALALEEVVEGEGAFVVLTEGERIVGFVAGIVEKQSERDLLDQLPSRKGRVTELYLEADYRQRGFGKKLLTRMEQLLQEKGCDTVWIEVLADNPVAHEFYQRQGYQNRFVDLVKKLET